MHSNDYHDIEEAHTMAFKHHFDSLYNYGMKVVNDSELVKDAIQELFFRIWRNNIDLSAIKSIKPYLLKGLRHQLLNYLQLKYYQTDKVEVEENIKVEFSPEDYYIQHQIEEDRRNKVIQALNRLSAKQREAIYLRYFEDLEYMQIAEIMGINLQSAKNNVQRGLNALKDLLGFVMFYYLFKEIFQIKV
ncbi:MAG TPA: RNA polymerase sigma factor [Bacteroidales bacterium]